MKVDMTPAQLKAIKNLADDCYAMLGAGGEKQDEIWERYIKHIDNMLARNKLPPRNHNGY